MGRDREKGRWSVRQWPLAARRGPAFFCFPASVPMRPLFAYDSYFSQAHSVSVRLRNQQTAFRLRLVVTIPSAFVIRVVRNFAPILCCVCVQYSSRGASGTRRALAQFSLLASGTPSNQSLEPQLLIFSPFLPSFRHPGVVAYIYRLRPQFALGEGAFRRSRSCV